VVRGKLSQRGVLSISGFLQLTCPVSLKESALFFERAHRVRDGVVRRPKLRIQKRLVHMKIRLSTAIAGVCLLVIGVRSAKAQFENWVPSKTFANPRPQNEGRFGATVASVGNGLVLIGTQDNDTGARGDGAVYLYDLSGALLKTYTKPSPADSGRFGRALAGVGGDKVLIGAPVVDVGTTNTGAAYLYDLNGGLLTLYTNPTSVSGSQFGRALTSVGSDKVLIGAPTDHGGAAYLFDLAGTLLATYTSPNPRNWSGFGGH